MRKTIVAALVAIMMTLGMGGVAEAGNGKAFKDCFGVSYGQSGLNYGQLKKNAPHPLGGGYGLPDVLAAHGPDGAIPLVAPGCAG